MRESTLKEKQEPRGSHASPAGITRRDLMARGVSAWAALALPASTASPAMKPSPQKPVPPKKKPAPAAPNAFDLYLAATKAIVGKDEIGRAVAVPNPLVPARRQPYTLAQKEAVLRKNARALMLLRRGLPHPFTPSSHTGEKQFHYFGDFRTLARLLKLEGQVRAARGDLNDAMASYLDAIRFGEHVQNHGGVIALLVGTAIEVIGREPITELLPRLTLAELSAAARRVEALLETHVPFAEIVRGDADETLAEMERDFRKYDPQGRRITPLTQGERELIKLGIPVEDQSFSSDFIRRFGKKEALTRSRAYLDRIAAVTQGSFCCRPRELFRTTGNPIRKDGETMDLLADNLAFMTEGNWLRSLNNLTQNRFLAVRLALHAHRLEHGAYPAALSALVPSHLGAVPRDPYAVDAPLRYARRGPAYMLYSVGPDGKDDGGKPIDAPTDEDGSPNTDRTRHIVRPESRGDVVAGVNVN